ncbi:MAG: succinylglutamate desuccinylase/aspartoacylase family protein, partial [Bdellovibrionales bacterium]|nr:succinylglutamate desuccinylase/aspartoacylase family protein [Bdellovibrionales bacterium]
MKSLLNGAILSILLFGASIALAIQPTISSYLVRGLADSAVQKIAEEFEVSRTKGNTFEVIVPAHRRVDFLRLAPGARLLEADVSQEIRKTFLRARTLKQGADNYHSFPEVVKLLSDTAAANPKLTQLVNYGTSKLGKPLLALRVSGQLKSKNAIPRVLLTAATHGDEIITTEILLTLMKTMITKASSDPRIQAILSSVEVTFIPVVNPDGFSEQNRYDNG